MTRTIFYVLRPPLTILAIDSRREAAERHKIQLEKNGEEGLVIKTREMPQTERDALKRIA